MKRIINILSIVSAFFIIQGCESIEVEAPDSFNVSINKNTFIVGDTAKFSLTGNVQNLVFYSGDVGNNYDDVQKFSTTDVGLPEMTFTTAFAGSPTTSGTLGLSVLVSNDFSGIYQNGEITKATWTDITSRVILNTTNQRVVLTEFKSGDKPLYIAFRYQSVNGATQAQRTVTISNFSFRTVFPNQIFTNATNVYNAGFGSFDLAGNVGFWNISNTNTNSTSFVHLTTPAGSADDNDWAVSKPMNVNSISPSVGTVLKNITAPMPVRHNFRFTKAGTYKMVFVGQNATNSDDKKVVKEFAVTVNP
jgi:Domain of unknown function (DUF5017)